MRLLWERKRKRKVDNGCHNSEWLTSHIVDIAVHIRETGLLNLPQLMKLARQPDVVIALIRNVHNKKTAYNASCNKYCPYLEITDNRNYLYRRPIAASLAIMNALVVQQMEQLQLCW